MFSTNCNHNFNVEVAIQTNERASVIVTNIAFLIKYHMANEDKKYFHEGRYWAYYSLTALEKLHPYATYKQIKVAVRQAVEAGILIKGRFNKLKQDKTTWYALTDKALEIFGLKSDTYKSENAETRINSDEPSRAHPSALEGSPLPIKQSNKNNNNIQAHKEPDISNSDIKRVIDYYVLKTKKHNKRYKYTPKRIKLIEEALKTFQVEECIKAIDGNFKNPWNQGYSKDEKGNWTTQKTHNAYNSLELIFRNEEKIEQFISYLDIDFDYKPKKSANTSSDTRYFDPGMY